MTTRFEYIPLEADQRETVDFFRKAFTKLETNIDTALPLNSREKSLVLTKLEEAAFWLNKAISRIPEQRKDVQS